MRGLVVPAKYRFKQMCPVARAQGILVTSTPKKQENNESGVMGQDSKEIAEAIVTFSRPPPLPPVLGPLVVLSLLDAWLNRSSDDD